MAKYQVKVDESDVSSIYSMDSSKSARPEEVDDVIVIEEEKSTESKNE